MSDANRLEILHDLMRKALAAGADAVDAVLSDVDTQSVHWRNGGLESVDDDQSEALGLRVLIGKHQAFVSTTDYKTETLNTLTERAVAMARIAPEDPFTGLADPDQLASNWPKLEMADTEMLNTAKLQELARAIEESALAHDGITQSGGTTAACGQRLFSIVASNGFAGQYRRTSFSLSGRMLAGADKLKVQDSDFATTILARDLPSPTDLGKTIAQRVLAKQGARKIATRQTPIVFDPRAANSLLDHFTTAINGAAIARGTSFLLKKMGASVFPDKVSIIDDPLRPLGLRSRPFDGEGLATQRRALAEKGCLTTWLLDLRSARQLNLQSTGHGVRGISLPSPAPSNLYIEAGEVSPKDMIKNIKNGLYITDLMGQGVNLTTGDYSRAATGFCIEDGEITYPFDEVTIASNLNEMFAHLHAADDLVFKYGIDTPTLCVENMTAAGL